MATVCCPDCGREWDDDDLLDVDEVEKLEAQVEKSDEVLREAKEQLRLFIDAFDRAQGNTMTWVFDRGEIRILRRLVEGT